MNHPIPKSVLEALRNGPWVCDEDDLQKFQAYLKHHKEADRRDGCTSAYFINDSGADDEQSLSAAEFAAMLKEGVVPDWARAGESGVNQHWLHSLEQFFAECTAAWDEHLRRTEALVGTPAGVVRRN